MQKNKIKFIGAVPKDGKYIILFERYDGVRFVLERSLSKYNGDITIHASHWEKDITDLIDNNHVDLLITELSNTDQVGLKISRYARINNPSMKIIWITVLGCDVFRKQRNQLGNVQCIEKPLEINKFRQDVLDALGMLN